MEYEKLLEETKEFREKLGEFRTALDLNDHNGVGRLTSELTILWGSIGDDLIALGMPHQFEASGRQFPIIESALSPSFHEYEPDHQTLDIAQQAIETAIGKLNRAIRNKPALPPAVVAVPEPPPTAPPPVPETPPGPVPVVPELRGLSAIARVLVVLALVAFGWFVGRHQDEIVAALGGAIGTTRAWLAVRSGLVKIGIGTVATVAVALFTNLFSSLVHEGGWIGIWRKHPLKAALYVLLLLLSALTIAAMTWPYSGPDTPSAQK